MNKEFEAKSPPVAADAPYTPLVLDIMKQMNLSEKMALVAGTDDPEAGKRVSTGYLPGIPRLGVPPRRDSDGDGLDTHGIGESTSFPSRIGVAATFDRSAAKDQGIIQGREALACGVDLMYAPQVDICRSPNFGRNNTTFGEDPYLSGQMAIGEVTGMQSQGLMAQVKHFIMYNGQAGVPFAWRPTIPTVVDDYTLHEIYLPPFEAAIKDAEPSSIMGSYQMFRVTPQQLTPNWACGNSHTLVTILRGQLDFKGFVLSDYGATHATDEILNGLDQQYMNARPSVMKNFGGPYFGADLLPFVDPDSSYYSLTYAQALDRAVAYVLYQYERFGLIGGTAPKRPKMDKEAGIAVSLRLAEESAVLLKNDNGVLPLTAKSNIALIGPTGRQLMANGMDAERSSGYSDRVAISPLQAMQEYASVTYSPGIDWMGTTIFEPDEELKLGESYTWTMKLNVQQEATYYLWAQQNFPIPSRFYGDLWGVPQTKIFIDDVELPLVDIPVPPYTYPNGFMPEGGVNLGASRFLKEGEHEVKITTVIPASMEKPAMFRVTWSNLDESISQAVETARKAEVAVVFVDDNGGPASVDTLVGLNTLAENQDRLIKAIVAANKKTVVVVTSGNLVSMPWFDEVSSVLEVWYPGQEGGTAIANLLMGKTNPSGHLPLTLPKSWDDTAFANHPERYLGKNGEVVFTDGIYVGYRWYDNEDIEPLLPFGFGLSYTNFEYSGLKITPAENNGLDVCFTVKNTGSIKGTAVPQVYVGCPEEPAYEVPYAKKSLAQFARTELAGGEEREVTMHIAPRALEHWCVNSQQWVRDLGKRIIYVGDSYRHILLSCQIDIACIGGSQSNGKNC